MHVRLKSKQVLVSYNMWY